MANSITEIVAPIPMIIDSVAELLSDSPELKIEIMRPSGELVNKYGEDGYHYMIILDPRMYCMIKEVEPNIFHVLKFNGNNDFEFHAEYNRKI